MPIFSTVFVQASVGRRGTNASHDVRTIQTRLNQLMHAPRIPLVVDGKCGRKTRGMIRDFQISVVGFRRPDSRVDPGGKTLAKLNDASSEGIWGKMSIPPQPSPAPTPEEPKDVPAPIRTGEEIVDAALEEIEAKRPLSDRERDRLRALLLSIWKDQNRGKPPAPVHGLPPNQVKEHIAKLKLCADVGRTIIVALGPALEGIIGASALLSATAALSMICVALMPLTFFFALQRSMGAHYRIYAAVAQAYTVAWWVHGGPMPKSSPAVLNRHKTNTPNEVDPARDAETWRRAQNLALEGMRATVAKLSQQSGLSIEETEVGLRAILKLNSQTEICKEIFQTLHDEEEKKGMFAGRDPQFSNVMRAYAKSRDFKYGE